MKPEFNEYLWFNRSSFLPVTQCDFCKDYTVALFIHMCGSYYDPAANDIEKAHGIDTNTGCSIIRCDGCMNYAHIKRDAYRSVPDIAIWVCDDCFPNTIE